MNIVCISDTHMQHTDVILPEGDMLIHAGDMLNKGNIGELIVFNEWLEDQPFKYKIVVAGNHDVCFEQDPDIIRYYLTAPTYLQDSLVEIEGIRIYGSPWQPEFNNWAFNLPRGAALRQKWQLIPDQLDILITHGPPMADGKSGHVPMYDWSNLSQSHVGCEELNQRVKEVKPKHHIFGHIHSGYGEWNQDGIHYMNVSQCDDKYNITNKPVVITI